MHRHKHVHSHMYSCTHMQIHIYAYKNTQKIRNALLQSIYLHAQQISLSLRLLEILQHNKIVDFFLKKT